MRLVLAISALLLNAHLAFAQQAPPPAPAASAAHVEAARSMSRMLLIESDVVGVGIRAAFDVLEPRLRQQVLSGPAYDNLRPDTQRSLTHWVDGFQALMQEELGAEMGAIGEDFAQRMTTVFTEEEMTDIASFLAQPIARSAYLKSVEHGARTTAAGGGAGTPPPSLTPEEVAAFAEFGATPAGQAMDRNSDRTMQMLGLALEAGTQRLMPRLQQRIPREMCAAMGDECPPGLRAAMEAQ
ncbi:MAG: hypothetical protein ABL883_11240 [Terricaulis sp.]